MQCLHLIADTATPLFLGSCVIYPVSITVQMTKSNQQSLLSNRLSGLHCLMKICLCVCSVQCLSLLLGRDQYSYSIEKFKPREGSDFARCCRVTSSSKSCKEERLQVGERNHCSPWTLLVRQLLAGKSWGGRSWFDSSRFAGATALCFPLPNFIMHAQEKTHSSEVI